MGAQARRLVWPRRRYRAEARHLVPRRGHRVPRNSVRSRRARRGRPHGSAMMTDSFNRHGIDHLSASSLNLWAAQPALWIMERLLGRRAPLGIPAARGKAVEHGVHLGLVDPAKPIDECAAEAE